MVKPVAVSVLEYGIQSHVVGWSWTRTWIQVTHGNRGETGGIITDGGRLRH